MPFTVPSSSMYMHECLWTQIVPALLTPSHTANTCRCSGTSEKGATPSTCSERLPEREWLCDFVNGDEYTCTARGRGISLVECTEGCFEGV